MHKLASKARTLPVRLLRKTDPFGSASKAFYGSTLLRDSKEDAVLPPLAPLPSVKVSRSLAASAREEASRFR